MIVYYQIKLAAFNNSKNQKQQTETFKVDEEAGSVVLLDFLGLLAAVKSVFPIELINENVAFFEFPSRVANMNPLESLYSQTGSTRFEFSWQLSIGLFLGKTVEPAPD